MSADLIILAAVAVFILLRLYGVLGQQVGRDESQTPRDTSFDSNSKVIELTPKQLERATTQPPEEDTGDELLPDDVKDGVTSIRKHDAQFRMDEFLEGAKVAFEMVLEAFAKDDQPTLKSLLSKDIYAEFAEALKTRKAQATYTETTLVSILETTPKFVQVKDRKAQISVFFLSEQIQVERDDKGVAVENTTSAIEQVEDVWIFQRDLRSANPNWQIIDT